MCRPRVQHPLCIALLAAAGSAAVPAVESGSDYTVRLIGGVWGTQLGGDFDASSGGTDGDSFDVDEFGLDDLVVSPMVEAGLALPLLFEFHAGAFRYGVDGTTELTAPRFYNGVQIDGTTTTDVEVTDMFGEVAWRVLGFDLTTVSVGLAVHYIDASVAIDSDTGSERVDESFPLPALAARVSSSPWGGWTIDARLHLMALEVGDVDANYVDAFAAINYRFTEVIGIQGGYRITDYAIDVELDGDAEIALDLAVHGPYLGVVAQF